MPDYLKVAVPAAPDMVKQFVTDNKDNFLEALNEVRKIISNNLIGVDIYKIYGREDKQNGDILKEPRKIRLKFNSYYKNKEKDEGSLWATPDVIGFTIVVPYPSTISKVCKRIDDLVDEGIVITKFPEIPKDSEAENEIISTAHGRSFLSKGYFGCHYNLTLPAVNPEKAPICEIQIKTVLHDAWGAKTHDLTYKNTSHVDQSLIKGFEILGDTLAKIDQQSDLIRDSIERYQAVRQNKKNKILHTIVNSQLQTAFARAPSLAAEKSRVLKVNRLTSPEEVQSLARICLKAFNCEDKLSGGTALFFVGFQSGDERCENNGREALQEWEDSETDFFGKARAISISGLMAFFKGDTGGAIIETERALKVIRLMTVPNEIGMKHAYFRRHQSIVSTLSYYYAELIGSHEGKQIEAPRLAKKHLKETLKMRPKLLGCPNSAFADNNVLQRAIRSRKYAYSNFSSLDSELFVRSQICNNLREMTKIRLAMQNLHKNPPRKFSTEAGQLFDFHDFCARARLMELERNHSSSSHP